MLGRHGRGVNPEVVLLGRAWNLCSLQLRVLRLGLLQDGDVGVGVFSIRNEILVGGEADLVARSMIPPSA